MCDSDPLDLKVSEFYMSTGKNAILDAFETAASSYRVHAGFPDAKYYQIPKPSLPTKFDSVELETIQNGTEEEESNQDVLPPHIQKIQDHNVNTLLPPLPEGFDPDKARLLHSWFWAGYYTGFEDGKKIK